MSFSLFEQNLCIVRAIPIQSQLGQSQMQIAEPVRNKGRSRQLDGSLLKDLLMKRRGRG
jgi:hypothetical protein